MTAVAERTSTPATTPRKAPRGAGPLLSVLAWIVGLGFFFPVLWMVMNGFK